MRQRVNTSDGMYRSIDADGHLCTGARTIELWQSGAGTGSFSGAAMELAYRGPA